MKVVILCGGQGTRMREETEFRPKPMVEIGGRPILWHIMKLYAHHGLRDFILCLGYRGNDIKEYFLNYEAMNNDFTIELGRRQEIEFHGRHDEQNFRVTLADTGLPTMTGGRLRRIRRYVEDNDFLMTYGDGLSDIDLQRLIGFHKSHGKTATLTTVQTGSRFGVVDVDASGRVQKFAEKPKTEAWIAAGFFVFRRGIFDLLTGDDCVLEAAPLETLAQSGELMAYRHPGFFHPMDTYRDSKLLNEMWDAGQAPWRVWE